MGQARTMQWSDLLSRPRPTPSAHIVYGVDPNQIVDLWLPSGGGEHPVVVMIHGGCWTAAIANRTIMDWAAHDLTERGLAVWNIEFRSVDQPGGGYPGPIRTSARRSTCSAGKPRSVG